jgi:hypothetical protein
MSLDRVCKTLIWQEKERETQLESRRNKRTKATLLKYIKQGNRLAFHISKSSAIHLWPEKMLLPGKF